MGVRKSATRLTTTERDNFLKAVLTLKNTIANPADPPAQRISIWDQFVAIHYYVFTVIVPGGATVNMGHSDSGFCPWHRYYLLRLEQLLQAVDPTVMLPYWDWTDHAGTQNIIFQDSFLSPNGGAGGVGGGTVQSGYFAFNAPGVLPLWWPAGFPGWRIRASLEEGFGTTLRRTLGSFANLAIQSDVTNTLGRLNFEGGGGFRGSLEAALRMHNGTHNWVGGHMGGGASPNDPIFYMHHCNIDRLWAMWQINGHQGAAFYPAAGRTQGHNLNDIMWPWVGATPGYSPASPIADIVLPNFAADPIIHPADVLDHRALGYSYDSEPVAGLTLDQSGSMNGTTPDPMTGMGSVSKWQAAKQGVSFFLFDCEAAFAAAEAYVTVGVETFRQAGGGQFAKVFPGTPYGVVKSGGAYSQAAFDVAIVPFVPGGGTPLAGALSDTETTLVRAPYGNLPANDQRYLLMLTDGKETAAPLLNTLANPAFPNTAIFAMGFGVGSGWDGVDYATIATIAGKGKSVAPVVQVYHGDSAGAIDKFYTNSIAAAIGYTPAVDPLFELFPGEHVHMNFWVTDAEPSFMVTALGFDLVDENWEFCLMAPNGAHCCDSRREHHSDAEHDAGHGHAEGGPSCPCLTTMRKAGGRCTIFVHRNGAPADCWVGPWGLMAFYRARPDQPIMVMPHIADLLVPASAPPARGPLFARLNQSPKQRLAVREIAAGVTHSLAGPRNGPAERTEGPATSLSVNVYHRTALQANLLINAKSPFAGGDFEVAVEFNGLGSLTVADAQVAARLIAPAYSIGNLLADTATIPERKKYLVEEPGGTRFDTAQFLADYESKRPEAIRMRDEKITLKRGADGKWKAKIQKNIHPGLYHIAAYAEGSVDLSGKAKRDRCCDEQPQKFTRVLHAAVGLGLLPDASKSTLSAKWVKQNLRLEAVVRDSLGNLPDPTTAPPPEVVINGEVVEGKLDNNYTGTYVLEVSVQGPGFEVGSNRKVGPKPGWVQTKDGKRLELPVGKKLKLALRVARIDLPVTD